MRLTRTPVRTPYRPTPIPPPFPMGLATNRPVDPSTATGQPPDLSGGTQLGRAPSPILPIIIASLLVLCLVGIAAISLARTYDLSPATLIAAIGSIHAPIDTPVPALAKKVMDKPAQIPTPPQIAKPPKTHGLTSRAWSLWKDDATDLFDATIDTPRTFQTVRVFPVGFDIIEGGTIQSDQTRIRLAWIISMPANAICLSDQSIKIACGLMARAWLSILASHEKLSCYPDVSIDTENPLFLCQSRGRDLSLAQIEAGFALPAQPSLDALNQLEAKAQALHAGAWSGDWTVLPAGGAPVPGNAIAQ